MVTTTVIPSGVIIMALVFALTQTGDICTGPTSSTTMLSSATGPSTTNPPLNFGSVSELLAHADDSFSALTKSDISTGVAGFMVLVGKGHSRGGIGEGNEEIVQGNLLPIQCESWSKQMGREIRMLSDRFSYYGLVTTRVSGNYKSEDEHGMDEDFHKNKIGRYCSLECPGERVGGQAFIHIVMK